MMLKIMISEVLTQSDGRDLKEQIKSKLDSSAMNINMKRWIVSQTTSNDEDALNVAVYDNMTRLQRNVPGVVTSLRDIPADFSLETGSKWNYSYLLNSIFASL
jgi:hypothetical protein